MPSLVTRAAPAAPLVLAGLGAPVAAQSMFTVVPAAYATTDANSQLWIPGATDRVRQQTLIAAHHLQPLLGRRITAIEFRRTAVDEAYAGGCTNLTVQLTITPRTPLQASPSFAANAGPNPTVVFQGQALLPGSPPTTGQQVPWNVSNVLRIPLRTPFAYTGGTLCIDIVGDPVLGHGTWWMADAAYEDLQGIAQSRGAGCGSNGGPSGAWAHAGARSLLPGAWAEFFAYGSAAGPAFAMFGMPAATPLPLSTFGLPTPCALHLGSLDILLPTLFEPQGPTGPGRADLGFRIPDSAAVFGFTGSVQWLDWQQLATSNAIDWTVAASMPSLGMALIEGHPDSPEGNLTVHHAHVLRFEHQ